MRREADYWEFGETYTPQDQPKNPYDENEDTFYDCNNGRADFLIEEGDYVKGNGYVSMKEAFYWGKWNDYAYYHGFNQVFEHPQYSDDGDIGGDSYL